jgi:hypothetical protein
MPKTAMKPREIIAETKAKPPKPVSIRHRFGLAGRFSRKEKGKRNRHAEGPRPHPRSSKKPRGANQWQVFALPFSTPGTVWERPKQGGQEGVFPCLSSGYGLDEANVLSIT